MAASNASKPRYMDFCMKCWRLLSMGSRSTTNPVRYWFVLITILAINTFLITFMYKHIFLHATDIDGIAEVVDFATLFTAGIFRYVHAFANGHRYDELVNYVHDNFLHESGADGQKLTMSKFGRKIKIISYSYLSLVILWVTQITAGSIVGGLINKNAPRPHVVIPVDLPFDVCTPFGEILTYLVHFTSYYTMGFIYCICDNYWFVIIMLTTAQFELISHSLRSLAEDNHDETDFAYVERVVTSCLNHHQVLRRCIRMMEDLLSSIVLIDFLHAVTSITFILFDMTIAINQQSLLKVMNLLGYFLLSVGHMWILDYFGNEMTLKEQDISAAIYEIPWYKYPKKIRTETILMIILSSHPYKLTGGKFFSLSLEFFAKSMRTIFSYFTVLLQLREK